MRAAASRSLSTGSVKHIHRMVCFLDSGFINILNYIINFYSGVDTEVRDPRGFTALIKAGLQGREECVAALLMHGMNRGALAQLPWRNKSLLMDWSLKSHHLQG